MTKNLLPLYQQRLDNLTETVNYLHEIVGVDEALVLLNDQKLVRYKIDRVHEIVREVLNSEKEQIILRLIEKCQNIQASQSANRMQVDAFESEYYRKYEQCVLELGELKDKLKLLIQEKKAYLEQKSQLQGEIVKYKNLKMSSDNLCIDGEEQKVSLRQRIKQSEIGYKNLELQYVQKCHGIEQMQRLLKQSQTIIQSLTDHNSELKQNKPTNQPQTARKKIQRVEALKRQIVKLSSDLAEMKEMFNMFRGHVGNTILSQLKALKKSNTSLKESLKEDLNSLLKLIEREVSSKVRVHLGQKQDMGESENGLMRRMQSLEGELTQFIEKQILL